MRLVRSRGGGDEVAEATEAGLRRELAEMRGELARALDRPAPPAAAVDPSVQAAHVAEVQRAMSVAEQLRAELLRAKLAQAQACRERDALRQTAREIAARLDAMRAVLARRPPAYRLPEWAWRPASGATRDERWVLWQARDELVRAARRIGQLEALLDEVARS